MQTLQELLEMANPKFDFGALEAALSEHGFQVSFDDWEVDGNTATAHFSSPEGQGDVRFKVQGKFLNIDMRGEGESGKEDERSGYKTPIQDYKDMAEEIDEMLGSFAHDLAEEDED